jgi:hypothetical protein
VQEITAAVVHEKTIKKKNTDGNSLDMSVIFHEIGNEENVARNTEQVDAWQQGREQRPVTHVTSVLKQTV